MEKRLPIQKGERDGLGLGWVESGLWGRGELDYVCIDCC